MYAIETELGRFEAETEREAKRMVKRASLEAQRQRDDLTRNQRAARMVAEHNACRIYSRFLSVDACPKAWIAYDPSHEMVRGMVTVSQDYIGSSVFKVQTPDGPCVADWWRMAVKRVIIDGGGWPMALAISIDGGAEMLCAVGGAEGALVLETINGITADWFCESKYA